MVDVRVGTWVRTGERSGSWSTSWVTCWPGWPATDVVGLADDEVHGVVPRLLAAVNQVGAITAGLVGSFDVRGLSELDACRTTRTWLIAFGRLSQGAAGGWLAQARLLRQFPALAARAGAGSVSAEQVRLVVALVDRVGVEKVVPFDAILADLAASAGPGELARACDRLRGPPRPRRRAARSGRGVRTPGADPVPVRGDDLPARAARPRGCRRGADRPGRVDAPGRPRRPAHPGPAPGRRRGRPGPARPHPGCRTHHRRGAPAHRRPHHPHHALPRPGPTDRPRPPSSTGPASTGPASTGPASTGPASTGRASPRRGQAAPARRAATTR